MALMLLMASGAAHAATLPALPVLPPLSKPASAQLANGLRLFVLPDSRAPVVTHVIAYRVGSKDDPPEQTGLAHYLEHLMFKPTENAPTPPYARQIETEGGVFNAFTSKSITAYYATVPRAALTDVMAWEAARMNRLVLDDAAAQTERDVILEERNARVDSRPAALLWEAMQQKLFDGTRFAAPIIGSRAHIATYRAADARRFYRCHYHAANALVVLIGDISMGDAQALAERYYGGAPAGKPCAPPAPPPQAAPSDWSQPLIRRDARAQVPLWQKLYRLPADDRRTQQDWLALDLMAHILGGEKSGRLHRAWVVDEPRFTHISAWLDDSAPDAAYVGLQAVPHADGDPDASRSTAEALAALAAEPVPDEELQRAKTALLARLYYAQDDQQHLALFYARRLANGWPLAELVQLPTQLQAVTAAGVQQAAQLVQSLPALEGVLLAQDSEDAGDGGEAGQ